MFVTFYSYKGGVGRSSSLINTAYYLAQTGRDICVIDFDLEAPGLHKMPCFKDENGDFLKSKNGGIVEYINSYIKTKAIPNLDEYLIKKEIDVTNKLINAEKRKSKLYLLPAGNLNDNSYSDNLNKIDWKDLYKEKLGYFLIEKLKKDLKNQNFDYIFVDSRTGFNDTSGICTIQIPDLVVLIFGLNEQNKEGIKSISQSLESKKIIPVVSPLPESITLEISQKLKNLDKELQFKNKSPIHIIPYNSLYSSNERIIFMEEHFELMNISHHYELLAESIIDLNKFDTNYLRDKIIEESNDISKLDELLIDSKNIIKKNPFSIDYFNHALLLFRKNDFKEAKKYIEIVIEKNNKNINFLYLEILILSKLDKDESFFSKIDYFITSSKSEIDKINRLKSIANLLININNIEKAKIFVDELKKLDPNDITSYSILYQYYKEKEQFEKAYVEVKTSIKKDDKNIQTFIELIEILKLLRKYDESLNKVDQALSIEPNNINLLTLKSQIFFKLAKFEEAISFLNKCIELENNVYLHYYNLAVIYYNLGEEEKALTFIEKALKVSPKNIDSKLLLAKINFNIGAIEKTISDISDVEALIQLSKNNKSNNIFELIRIYFDLNNLNKVNIYVYLLENLINYSEILENNKFKLNTYRNLAFSCMLIDNYEKAIEYYKKENVIKEYINEKDYFNLGFSYLKIGNLELSKKYFVRFLLVIDYLIKNVYFSDKINYLSCKAIALSYSDNENKLSLNVINECIAELNNNTNIKKIFSPKSYKYVQRDLFSDFCNEIKRNLESGKKALESLI